MKKLFVLMVTVVASFFPSFAHADLVGTTVNGVFNFNGLGTTNYFDPANALVPASGYGNSAGLPVVVGSGIEFGVSDNNILYTFDFSGTTLEVTNSAVTPATEGGWAATFTDTGITELSVLDNNIAGLSAMLSEGHADRGVCRNCDYGCAWGTYRHSK